MDTAVLQCNTWTFLRYCITGKTQATNNTYSKWNAAIINVIKNTYVFTNVTCQNTVKKACTNGGAIQHNFIKFYGGAIALATA